MKNNVLEILKKSGMSVSFSKVKKMVVSKSSGNNWRKRNKTFTLINITKRNGGVIRKVIGGKTLDTDKLIYKIIRDRTLDKEYIFLDISRLGMKQILIPLGVNRYYGLNHNINGGVQ